MYEERDGGRYRYVYSRWRWDDFVEYVEDAEATGEFAKGQRQSRVFGREHWTGTLDFDEAIELAKNGWPKGRELFADMAGQAALQMKEQRASISFDVAGSYPSIPRYLSGELENMVTSNPELQSVRKIIKIIVGLSVSHSNEDFVIKNRGAAIAGLIDAVEDAGNSVELAVFHHCEAGGDPTPIRTYTEIEVKKAGEPLDLDLLAFAITHPAVLRRLIFAQTEHLGSAFDDEFGRVFKRGNYGVPKLGRQPYFVEVGSVDGFLLFDGLAGRSNLFDTLPEASANILRAWETAMTEVEEERYAA